MLELLLAAALAQPDPNPEPVHCNAAERGDRPIAGCRDWRLMRRSPTLSLYYGSPAGRRDGDQVEILVRIVTSEPSQGGVRSRNSRFRLDCRQRTAQMLDITAFDAAGGRLGGGLVTSIPLQQAGPRGTPYGDMLAHACPG